MYKIKNHPHLSFQLVNNIAGWITFVIASITYILTVEPTASNTAARRKFNEHKSCPTRIRTWTDRTKICCATITQWDNHFVKDGANVKLFLFTAKKSTKIQSK